MKVIGKTIAERRRDKRLGVRPITVDLGGNSYTTHDWGLGGFRVEPYTGQAESGDHLRVRLIIDDGREQHKHIAEIKIVRVDRENHQLAANFVELDADTIDTLDGWLSGRLTRSIKKIAP